MGLPMYKSPTSSPTRERNSQPQRYPIVTRPAIELPARQAAEPPSPSTPSSPTPAPPPPPTSPSLNLVPLPPNWPPPQPPAATIAPTEALADAARARAHLDSIRGRLRGPIGPVAAEALANRARVDLALSSTMPQSTETPWAAPLAELPGDGPREAPLPREDRSWLPENRTPIRFSLAPIRWIGEAAGANGSGSGAPLHFTMSPIRWIGEAGGANGGGSGGGGGGGGGDRPTGRVFRNAREDEPEPELLFEGSFRRLEVRGHLSGEFSGEIQTISGTRDHNGPISGYHEGTFEGEFDGHLRHPFAILSGNLEGREREWHDDDDFVYVSWHGRRSEGEGMPRLWRWRMLEETARVREHLAQRAPGAAGQAGGRRRANAQSRPAAPLATPNSNGSVNNIPDPFSVTDSAQTSRGRALTRTASNVFGSDSSEERRPAPPPPSRTTSTGLANGQTNGRTNGITNPQARPCPAPSTPTRRRHHGPVPSLRANGTRSRRAPPPTRQRVPHTEQFPLFSTATPDRADDFAGTLPVRPSDVFTPPNAANAPTTPFTSPPRPPFPNFRAPRPAQDQASPTQQPQFTDPFMGAPGYDPRPRPRPALSMEVSPRTIPPPRARPTWPPRPPAVPDSPPTPSPTPLPEITLPQRPLPPAPYTAPLPAARFSPTAGSPAASSPETPTRITRAWTRTVHAAHVGVSLGTSSHAVDPDRMQLDSGPSSESSWGSYERWAAGLRPVGPQPQRPSRLAGRAGPSRLAAGGESGEDAGRESGEDADEESLEDYVDEDEGREVRHVDGEFEAEWRRERGERGERGRGGGLGR